LKIAIIAGEISGDILGAGLVKALKMRYPQAQFEGIGGEGMMAAGLHSVYPLSLLSVMGLVEVLGRYRQLKACHHALQQRWFAEPPDVFIGIDAPDFNLPMAAALKKKGIKTVHYVSPSVWAWREYRLKKIALACDCMLTLFPFEAKYYQDRHIPVRFVGHPLAEQIPFESDPQAARQQLALDPQQRYVALLPGSRVSEIKRLLPTFLLAAQLLSQQHDVQFLLPCATAELRQLIEPMVAECPVSVILIDQNSRLVMAAADVILLASGTATLEALLLKKPMVIAYKLASLTYYMAKMLVRVKYVGLPNLLSEQPCVPEFIQHQANPDALSNALSAWLQQPERVAELQQHFQTIHTQLCQQADQQAANAVVEVLAK